MSKGIILLLIIVFAILAIAHRKKAHLSQTYTFDKKYIHKRYWLRGGLIICGISIVLMAWSILGSIIPLDTNLGTKFVFGIFMVPLFVSGMLIPNGGIVVQVVASLLFYFCLGALIGWIYGKIKTR